MEQKEPLLSITGFQKYQKEGYTLIDTRSNREFAKGFIPGSINLQPDEDFENTASPFLLKNQYFLLVTDKNNENSHATLMKDMGFENLLGVLNGGFPAWKKAGLPIDIIISVSPDEFELEYKHGDLYLIDIREQEAFDLLHIAGSNNFEPEVLINNYDRIDDAITNCIYCVNGRLSMTLISFLKFNEKHNLYHVDGGFAAIRKFTDVKMVKQGQKPDMLEKFRGNEVN